MLRVRHRRLLSRVVILAASIVVLVAAPAGAENTCQGFAPQQPMDIRGVTWSGTVVRDEAVGPADDLGIQRWTIVFQVDHVYANARPNAAPFGQALAAGHRFRLANSTCGRPGDLGLDVGRRYVFSTSGFLVNVTPPDGTAAWLLDGNHATFVDMYSDTNAAAVFRQANDLDAVLSLAAPDAVLPPTDGYGDAESAASFGSAVPMAALILGLAMGVALRRRGRWLAP